MLPGFVSSRRVDEQVVACGVVIPDPDPERRASSRAIALLRNRKFVDSLLERNGFELPVRGRGQSDCHPFGLRLAALGFAGRANSPHDSLPERDGVELLVPCRKKNESRSGTGTETVTKVTKVRLEAVVYLPDTDASKPSPSSRESANRHRLGP